jgi:hypothetical protein
MHKGIKARGPDQLLPWASRLVGAAIDEQAAAGWQYVFEVHMGAPLVGKLLLYEGHLELVIAT